jgi:hypothetical protein
MHWLGAAAAIAALAGGALIAGHARYLARATASTPQAANEVQVANIYQAALPGAQFGVPAQGGIQLALQSAGVVLVAAGMQPAPPVRVDLCSQLRAPGDARLVPLRLGYRFEDVQRWVAHEEGASAKVALRNMLLVDAQDGEPMPEVQLSGMARADFADPVSEPLQLNWRTASGTARWVSDASLGQIEEGASAQVGLRQQGWLIWGAGSALRVERRANAMCPQAGDLVVQMYRLAASNASTAASSADRALVVAFPARGKAISASLLPGQYQVPTTPGQPLEDQALFQSLQDQGLVRLNADGAIELAPRDLLQWSAADASQRAAPLAGWEQVRIDRATRKLFKRLYYQADGAYVRQQIDIFNNERRLLAWRSPASTGALPWVASVPPAEAKDAAMDIATTQQMPTAASRLFAELPQGWLPWTRATRGGAVRLTLDLPRAASGGEAAQLLVAGRVKSVAGASMQVRPACTGRACRRADDVQQLTLSLNAGTRSVDIDVQPLDFTTLEDQKYRHLRVNGGRLVWQPLATPGERVAGSGATAPASVQLRDRNGTPLWADGAPTPAASSAGLATLLGVGSDHPSSIAGVLSRLTPDAAGGVVSARLSLDLPLQALSQQVLDCIAMRRGHWDGKACTGGHAAPAERHAGLIILDTENGDILAAAGAGTGTVTSANWPEVRDFDRTSPARSPLRLPALQHDGGAHQSPGSTFKVISALGLELAAQNDPQLDALIGGMPLAAINHLASQRGFGFQTEAATYPNNARLAHITNYKEQSLNRRAEEGRLGLAQALTYSLNTWFAWSSELSDRSLFGRPDGGAPDLQALDADALDRIRPIVAAARRLGFEQPLHLDGGLLPADFNWRSWDALQATPAHIDPIHTRHELRQMSIGLRMQVTPLQMALASAAVGQGHVVTPRLLLNLGSAASSVPAAPPLGIRLDRIRAGMKGVVDVGTGAGAFSGPALAELRRGLYGKTGTAPSGDDTATVWFTGWLEAGSLPGQTHRLAMAAFASHSEATGGEHAAPVIAAILSTLAGQNKEQKGK